MAAPPPKNNPRTSIGPEPPARRGTPEPPGQGQPRDLVAGRLVVVRLTRRFGLRYSGRCQSGWSVQRTQRCSGRPHTRQPHTLSQREEPTKGQQTQAARRPKFVEGSRDSRFEALGFFIVSAIGEFATTGRMRRT